jgi:hypothetical protein
MPFLHEHLRDHAFSFRTAQNDSYRLTVHLVETIISALGVPRPWQQSGRARPRYLTRVLCDAIYESRSTKCLQ